MGFSSKGTVVQSSPILPIDGGTPNVFLEKWEFATPADKTPRLELHLRRTIQQMVQGKAIPQVQRQIILINDPVAQPNAYDGLLEDTFGKYVHIILAYRPDLVQDDIDAIDKPTWQEYTEAIFALLPPDYAQIETTWKLVYHKGKDPLTIPGWPPFVMQGTGKFKMNPKFDKIELAPTTTAADQESQFGHVPGVPMGQTPSGTEGLPFGEVPPIQGSEQVPQIPGVTDFSGPLPLENPF